MEAPRLKRVQKHGLAKPLQHALRGKSKMGSNSNVIHRGLTCCRKMKQGRKLARQTGCTRTCGRESPELRLCHHTGWGARQSSAGPGKTLTKYQSNELNSKTLHSINENTKPSTHQEQTHLRCVDTTYPKRFRVRILVTLYKRH